MEARPYYQTETVDHSSNVGRTAKPPLPLRWVRAAVWMLIALLLALPLLMSLHRDPVLESIVRGDPFLSASALEFAIVAVVIYTWVLHAVYGAATLWFSAMTLRGRNWARIALTVTMVIATMASYVSAAAGVEYLWAVIPSDILQIAIIVLIWLPKSSRDFFAAHTRDQARVPARQTVA